MIIGYKLVERKHCAYRIYRNISAHLWLLCWTIHGSCENKVYLYSLEAVFEFIERMERWYG